MKIYMLTLDSDNVVANGGLEGYMAFIIIAPSANAARKFAEERSKRDDFHIHSGMDWMDINKAKAIIVGRPSGVFAASSDTRMLMSEGRWYG